MGIVGLTKTVAKEWGAFGIRCNTVAFGYIDTRLTQAKEKGETIAVGDKEVILGIPEKLLRPERLTLIPLGRAGTAEEAAGGIVMMASPFAAYITGHTLEVTGGRGI
jgi:3-oxoacyl-[acyl-carrier protein] reductase